MHHTLVNFSLLQVMGNMQDFKSKGLKLCCNKNKYDYLDRLDTFIYNLNNYFEVDDKSKDDTNLLKNSSKCNASSLKEYLSSFKDINKYCKEVYFIDDKEFIKKLIESGKQPISSSERVVEYMDLALEFWKIKATYFDKNSDTHKT